MRIVILGLSITSSWGNGHATTYRALVRALASRGQDVLFLERDVPWYAAARDLPAPSYCRVRLYGSVGELEAGCRDDLASADLVIVGSYVPEGVAVADLVLGAAGGCRAFYDIDTPVTLAAIERGHAEYLERRQIPRFDLYLTFTGGPTLDRLADRFGARCPRPLYCSVDPELYFEEPGRSPDRDLGYLGTYSADRQETVTRLLLEPAAAWPAGRFVVAGPQYPASIAWTPNVERLEHVPPDAHRAFYNRLRFTLNVTRGDMITAGFSPSVRLFEAAACGTPIISDVWPGLDTILRPGREIVTAACSREVLALLRELPEAERQRIGRAGRARVLGQHTAGHRAAELETYVREAARASGAHAPGRTVNTA
jgi:spore maturation protein CgeB